MGSFVKSVVVNASVTKVFGFHERADALELLTPAFPPVRVVKKTGGIKTGARVELRIVGLSWIALHKTYERNRLFVDEQISGPFDKWVHRHEFEDMGGDKTRLTDRVEYRLPGGAAVNALLGWAVKAGLEQMFRHRHEVTKKYCESL